MVEEKIIELYPTDVIQSPVHLSIGQELHTVVLMSLLQTTDRVFTTYRSHAAYLAKGGDLNLMFAELYGKQTGIAKGKAGSMHLCHPSTGLMGSSAIVGAVFSHAIGAAYADKLKKNGDIVLCLTGEGATEEGTFHECLNFSALKQLPLVYVIENNGLAINIPLESRQSYNLEALAHAYQIPYAHIEDSFDIDTIIAAARPLIEQARYVSKPAVIEIATYRYKEHVGISCDHNMKHRDASAITVWENRDPLIVNRDLDAYRDEITAEIQGAVYFAEKSDFPDHNELLKDVY
jgi:pyruvate dehydrogenase E1 component alpha subunit